MQDDVKRIAELEALLRPALDAALTEFGGEIVQAVLLAFAVALTRQMHGDLGAARQLEHLAVTLAASSMPASSETLQ